MYAAGGYDPPTGRSHGEKPSVHDQLFGENSRCPGQDEWLTIPDLMFSLQRLPGATKSQRFFAFSFSGW